MLEKVVNEPLVIPATDKRPELKFAQIGPMELASIKQRIRRDRLKVVLDVAPDNQTVIDEEVSEFVASPEGIVFLLYLSAKKAGMEIEENFFATINFSEPVWAEVVQWLTGGQQD